jgi:hypothetical protein
LLAEARNGYSGKSEASPISSNGDYPFFCTDRITVSRNANSPSGLLQQSWLAAIMQRVKGRREFVYYNMRSCLPLNRVPPFAQEVTYHHLVRLGHPTVGEWTVSGPHQDTADYQEAARLVGARVRARQTCASACRCALHTCSHRSGQGPTQKI